MQNHWRSRKTQRKAMKLTEFAHGCVLVAVGNAVLRTNIASAGEVDTIKHDKSGDSHVVSMCVSSDGSKLFIGYSNKLVACWDFRTLELLGSATLRKQPTSIQFGSFHGKQLNKSGDCSKTYDVLLASDKAGEVFALDAPKLSKQALLAGHTASVITDMAIHTSSSGKTLVATADRDEKVRISHFPDLENISTFCLAHTNVVASVTFVELAGRVMVLSTGWDHTLLLWDATTGQCLQSVSFLAPEQGSSSSASAPAAASTEEVPAEAAGEADADGAVNEDGEEDLEGKVYDELSAGNYPFKVACSPVADGTRALVAVLFKGKALMKVFELRAAADGTAVLSEVSSVALPSAPPVDVVFLSQSEVSVVLPKPQGMQVYSVGGKGDVRDVSHEKSFIAKIVAAADALGES
jgi:WD40 repeat protein